MARKILTRREFLKNSAAATLGSVIYLNMPAETGANQNFKKSKVVLIRNRDILDNLNRPNPNLLQSMLDEAVKNLCGINDPVEAWKNFINPNDIVGIKSNIWSRLRTPVELEKIIKTRVMDCGVEEDDIGIGDRRVLNDPLFKKATALINVRPLRTHDWSGVGSLIKNYIMFVNKPNTYHDDSCADLASIWKLPHIKDKTRLNILVMLTPLFHGIGPHHFNPEYMWNYNGLLVGFDPVAVDSVGLRILQAKRGEYFGEERPINPPAKHIYLADTRHNLGTADPDKIDLVRLGWEEDILI